MNRPSPDRTDLTLPDSFPTGKQALKILIGAATSGGMCLWLKQ
jgi:hypothetical protein